jgi:integrase
MTRQIKDVRPLRCKQQLDDMKWSLRKWCGERDYILFLIGINTGLRVADILKLKVKDVKGKKRLIIFEGKTDKKRTIHLHNIYDEIQAYIKTVNSEWLFPSRKGDKPISTTQAYRQLVKAGDMADIPEGIGTHTMRKTFGYWHYKQFKDVAELQDILNHSHPQITLTYIGVTDEQIENNMMDFVL